MRRTSTSRRTAATAALAAGLAGGTAAFGQAPMAGHGGMQHGGTPAAAAPSGPAGGGTAQAPSGAAGANHQEMMAAMERMNREMMAPQAMTGDPDRDLVAMMIPHHQGAIDMARIYLREGRDPQIRRLAQKIIADQEREIREMRAWQARHPGFR